MPGLQLLVCWAFQAGFDKVQGKLGFHESFQVITLYTRHSKARQKQMERL